MEAISLSQVRLRVSSNQQEDIQMVWLPHKRYTADYITAQMTEILEKVRSETRRMVLIATSAVVVMAVIQATYIYGL